MSAHNARDWAIQAELWLAAPEDAPVASAAALISIAHSLAVIALQQHRDSLRINDDTDSDEDGQG